MQNETTLQKTDYAHAWLLYLGQMTLDRISQVTGISEEKLYKRAKDYGWYHARTLAIQRAKSAVNLDLKNRIEKHRVLHQTFVLDQLSNTQEVIERIPDGFETVGVKLELLEQHDTIARKTLKLDEPDKSDPNTMGFHLLIALQKQSVGLVNDKQTDSEVSEIKELETSKTDALRRSIPFDDKNPTKPILRVLQGYPDGNVETKSPNSGQEPQNGDQKEEKQPKLIDLADKLGIAKGKGLPPLKL